MDDLQDVFRTVFRLSPEFDLRDSMSFADVPGWDSVGHMNLINELERRYSLNLELTTIAGINSVRDVRTILARRKRP